MISVVKGILLLFVLIWDYIFTWNLDDEDNYFYLKAVIIQFISMAAIITIVTC